MDDLCAALAQYNGKLPVTISVLERDQIIECDDFWVIDMIRVQYSKRTGQPIPNSGRLVGVKISVDCRGEAPDEDLEPVDPDSGF